jgi:cytochrome c-type biogenesis protein CcmH
MNILFWSLIAALTVAAWGFLAWPLRNTPGYLGKMMLVIFPLMVISLYWLFGGSQQLQRFWLSQQQNAAVAQRVKEIKNPQQLVDQLTAHLQQDPQSGEGWYLLGKLYLDQRRYTEAESALTTARRLQPKSGETMLALAKANFFNHQGHLTLPILTQLNSMLDTLPDPVDALNLLAVNSYRHQDFHQAVRYWQRALTLVQPGSPDSQTLQNMIHQAQQQE